MIAIVSTKDETITYEKVTNTDMPLNMNPGVLILTFFDDSKIVYNLNSINSFILLEDEDDI